MQLKRAPLQLARDDDVAVPADLDRTAAAITLVGTSTAVLAVFLPWLEEAAFGVSLSPIGIQNASILLAILAGISAGVAGAVLLRRPARASVAIFLIGLAVMQVGLVMWVGVNIVDAIVEADPHLVLIAAIGTGAYLGLLGSMITLVGSVMAWTKRRRG